MEDIFEDKLKKKKRKILVEVYFGAQWGTNSYLVNIFFGVYLLEGILDDNILWKSPEEAAGNHSP